MLSALARLWNDHPVAAPVVAGGVALGVARMVAPAGAAHTALVLGGVAGIALGGARATGILPSGGAAGVLRGNPTRHFRDVDAVRAQLPLSTNALISGLEQRGVKMDLSAQDDGHGERGLLVSVYHAPRSVVRMLERNGFYCGEGKDRGRLCGRIFHVRDAPPAPPLSGLPSLY